MNTSSESMSFTEVFTGPMSQEAQPSQQAIRGSPLGSYQSDKNPTSRPSLEETSTGHSNTRAEDEADLRSNVGVEIETDLASQSDNGVQEEHTPYERYDAEATGPSVQLDANFFGQSFDEINDDSDWEDILTDESEITHGQQNSKEQEEIFEDSVYESPRELSTENLQKIGPREGKGSREKQAMVEDDTQENQKNEKGQEKSRGPPPPPPPHKWFPPPPPPNWVLPHLQDGLRDKPPEIDSRTPSDKQKGKQIDRESYTIDDDSRQRKTEDRKRREGERSKVNFKEPPPKLYRNNSSIHYRKIDPKKAGMYSCWCSTINFLYAIRYQIPGLRFGKHRLKFR